MLQPTAFGALLNPHIIVYGLIFWYYGLYDHPKTFELLYQLKIWLATMLASV